jgi:hypothetical protein
MAQAWMRAGAILDPPASLASERYADAVRDELSAGNADGLHSDERSSEAGRGELGDVDGSGGSGGAHTETEEGTTNDDLRDGEGRANHNGASDEPDVAETKHPFTANLVG